MAENRVGLRPNVACEFKRAGFLEWRNDWNFAADWVATKPVTDEICAIGQAHVVAMRSRGLEVMSHSTRQWPSQLGSGLVDSAVDPSTRLWLSQLGSGSVNSAVAQSTRQWIRQLGCGSVNSAVDLLVQHFKKIAPLEFRRSVRPKADTKLRPSLLPSLVNWVELKKGMKRFSVRNK